MSVRGAVERVAGALRGAGSLLADGLWPRSCVVCGSDDEVGSGDVCAACWGKLVPPVPADAPKGVDSLAVAFGYDERMRGIVHRFKFEGVRALATPLARQLAWSLDLQQERFGGGQLLPVPDHPARRRGRGYNPARELAVELARLWQLPLGEPGATRLQHGPHQSMLTDAQRKRAAGLVFSVDPWEGSGPQPRLILVDDVIHTGTTLARLAEAARSAGWERVDAVCLCA